MQAAQHEFRAHERTRRPSTSRFNLRGSCRSCGRPGYTGSQCTVRTPAVVVCNPLAKDRAEMRLGQRNHPVQALTPDRADHCARRSRSPWGSRMVSAAPPGPTLGSNRPGAARRCCPGRGSGTFEHRRPRSPLEAAAASRPHPGVSSRSRAPDGVPCSLYVFVVTADRQEVDHTLMLPQLGYEPVATARATGMEYLRTTRMRSAVS